MSSGILYLDVDVHLFLRCIFFLGICGKTRIAEVGGVPYLLPLVNQKKVSVFLLFTFTWRLWKLIPIFILRRPTDQCDKQMLMDSVTKSKPGNLCKSVLNNMLFLLLRFMI